jgi:hypothetical protein
MCCIRRSATTSASTGTVLSQGRGSPNRAPLASSHFVPTGCPPLFCCHPQCFVNDARILTLWRWPRRGQYSPVADMFSTSWIHSDYSNR